MNTGNEENLSKYRTKKVWLFNIIKLTNKPQLDQKSENGSQSMIMKDMNENNNYDGNYFENDFSKKTFKQPLKSP